jgi:ABC-2 type transport system ATP-binding protein
MRRMIIEVENLEKHYGSFHALRGITLKVKGRRIGLLGPNGAGKTTLIKTLLGLLPYTSGFCKVLDVDVAEDPLEVRRYVGYMPENDAMMLDLTALEFVTFAAELCGIPSQEARGRAHSVLEHCGLGEVRYRRVSSYSTGMRQRVKLAQALVGDPKLLLLDEPTSGLDPRGREEMLDLIREIPERTRAHLLLSTHILPDVERTCEDVIVMNEGKVLYDGGLDALVRQEHDLFEVRIKGDLETYTSAVKAAGFEVSMDGSKLVARVVGGAAAEATGEQDRVDRAVRALLEAAVKAGAQVRHLQPLRATLEQAFLETVQRGQGERPSDAKEAG